MNQTKNSFWQRYFVTEAGYNLSWSSVIAGVVTFFAVFMMFSLITSAIGFGVLSPTSDNPLSGVGTGVIVWTVITLIVSLFSGGFVAGLAARRTGMLHGFLTWALSMILLFVMLTSTLFSVVGTLGRVVGGAVGFIGKTAGAATSKVAEVASDGISALNDQISNQIGEVDTQELQGQIRDILRDTDTPELQPEYIDNQMKAAREELVEAAKNIATNPGEAEGIINELGKSLTARVDNIAKSADKDALKAAVAKNTELTPEEADKAVENLHTQILKASDEAKVQIEKGKQALADAQQTVKENVDQTVEQAREYAETASNTVSTASILLFIGLLLGMILTSFAGYIGSKKVQATIIQE